MYHQGRLWLLSRLYLQGHLCYLYQQEHFWYPQEHLWCPQQQGHFLHVAPNGVSVSPNGNDPHAKLRVEHHHEDGSITLRSHENHALGFAEDGQVRPPNECADGPHTRVRFTFV